MAALFQMKLSNCFTMLGAGIRHLIIAGSVNRSVTFKSGEVIRLLYLVLMRLHVEYCAQFWASDFKKGVDR